MIVRFILIVHSWIWLFFSFKKVFSSFTTKKWLIQEGCSSENIKIVEEAAAILLFCLHDKQHTGVTTLDDDTCNRKYIVVECEGEYVYL